MGGLRFPEGLACPTEKRSSRKTPTTASNTRVLSVSSWNFSSSESRGVKRWAFATWGAFHTETHVPGLEVKGVPHQRRIAAVRSAKGLHLAKNSFQSFARVHVCTSPEPGCQGIEHFDPAEGCQKLRTVKRYTVQRQRHQTSVHRT